MVNIEMLETDYESAIEIGDGIYWIGFYDKQRKRHRRLEVAQGKRQSESRQSNFDRQSIEHILSNGSTDRPGAPNPAVGGRMGGQEIPARDLKEGPHKGRRIEVREK